jgi:predicted DNA-binding WGR domain protein
MPPKTCRPQCLGWHYRSRSESPISFSNWAFYDGRLLTCTEYRRLGGEGAGDRLDGLQRHTADPLLSRHSFRTTCWRHFSTSAGIAEASNRPAGSQSAGSGKGLTSALHAFSEAQQNEIEMALNCLASEDDEFRSLLDEEWQREDDGQFVGLLVKNLENIQGDERDVIILSICYGRGPNGKMLMNFGPINKSGGEKRLNVAFSRAKRHMAVISTIRYSEITNEYNEGANCLRNYLRYAEAMSSGDAATAQRVLGGVTRWKEQFTHAPAEDDDAVALQLAACLQKRGFVVDQGVGQSHFRVDLAVRLPEDGTYLLGILIDTPIQYEQAEPLERDVMRPRLLRAFGWQIESVLAKDWYENRDQELARIINILESGKQVESSELDDTEDEDREGDPGGEPPRLSTETAFDPETESVGQLDVEDGLSDGVELAADTDAQRPLVTPKLLPVPPGGKRLFEFREGHSSKFWEIEVTGTDHTVRFGRIGTSGQSQTKSFSSEAAAQKDSARLIAEKQRKGFREVCT